ncbi:hypothetical protein LA359_11495 [Mycobacterium kansasii]|nr:hypothetical protein LA359_11495 [Mycobacterium kansasii]
MRPGLVSPGLVRPGLVRPGLVRPGLVRSVPAALPPVRLGTGGRLMPNCESPCDRADISSPGKSATLAARTNSWCSGGLLPAVDS